MYIATLDIIG